MLVISEAAKSAPTISAAPTSYCGIRPIDYFHFQMDVLFKNDAQYWESFIDSEPVIGAPFKPILDAANELAAGASATMEAITGCVSTYPKPEPTATKTSKGKAAKKQSKKGKSGEKKSKAKKSKAKKGKKAEKAETLTPTEAELDVPALILEGIFLFTDNVYFMNSYNTPGGTAWTFGSDDRGAFEAIPVRDVQLSPGAFNTIVCGYKSLVDNLVLTHQQLTGLLFAAPEYRAEAVTIAVQYYGASSIVSYC